MQAKLERTLQGPKNIEDKTHTKNPSENSLSGVFRRVFCDL